MYALPTRCPDTVTAKLSLPAILLASPGANTCVSRICRRCFRHLAALSGSTDEYKTLSAKHNLHRDPETDIATAWSALFEPSHGNPSRLAKTDSTTPPVRRAPTRLAPKKSSTYLAVGAQNRRRTKGREDDRPCARRTLQPPYQGAPRCCATQSIPACIGVQSVMGTN